MCLGNILHQDIFFSDLHLYFFLFVQVGIKKNGLKLFFSSSIEYWIKEPFDSSQCPDLINVWLLENFFNSGFLKMSLPVWKRGTGNYFNCLLISLYSDIIKGKRTQRRQQQLKPKRYPLSKLFTQNGSNILVKVTLWTFVALLTAGMWSIINTYRDFD